MILVLLPPFFRSHPPGIPIAITPAPFIWSARSPSLPWTSPPRRAPVSAPISDFDGVADWDDLLDFFSKGGGSVTCTFDRRNRGPLASARTFPNFARVVYPQMTLSERQCGQRQVVCGDLGNLLRSTSPLWSCLEDVRVAVLNDRVVVPQHVRV